MGFVRLGKLSVEALEVLARRHNENERKARLSLVTGEAGSAGLLREERPSGAAKAREKANRAKRV